MANTLGAWSQLFKIVKTLWSFIRENKLNRAELLLGCIFCVYKPILKLTSAVSSFQNIKNFKDPIRFILKKISSRRAVSARRQEVRRRVARKGGASRRRRYGPTCMRAALFERVFSLQGRSVGGQALYCPRTKLALPIRRRVAWNGIYYPGKAYCVRLCTSLGV